MESTNEIAKYDYEDKPLRSHAFRSNERTNWFNQKKHDICQTLFQDAGMLSWSSMAARIWTWLAAIRVENAHKAGLMPTIVIDHFDYPHQKSLDDSLSIMHGETLYSFASVYMGGDTMIPVRSEIRVYPRSLKKLIKEYWHGHCPTIMVATMMTHTMLHELLHYITLSNLWINQFADDIDASVARDAYLNHVNYGISTVEDELSNEAKTLALLKRLVLSAIDGVTYSAIYRDEPYLLPVVGGRYDLQRRERDPIYREHMDAYEVTCELLGSYYFHRTPDEAEYWADRTLDIIERQEKEARETHQKVILMD